MPEQGGRDGIKFNSPLTSSPPFNSSQLTAMQQGQQPQGQPSTPATTIVNGTAMPNGAPAAADGSGAPDLSSIFAARRAEDLARRDRTLAEFLVMLDNYKPLVCIQSRSRG